MLKQEKKSIGGVTYLVTQMDGFRALKAQTKLIKILGPAVSGALSGGEINIKSAQANLFSKLPEMLSKFDDNIVNDFIYSLFEHGVFKQDSHGNPDKVDFDLEFTGRINDMWKVALFILEVNFFGGKSIMSSLPIMQAKEQVKSDMKN